MSSSSSSFRYPPGFPTWCCECLKKHHLPLTKACKAALHNSPVVVSSGTVDFELVLLSSDAIGTGAFSFSVGYSNLPLDPDSGDQVIGTGFQYTQDVSMAQGGDGSVSFRTAERTHEQFPHHPVRGFSSAKNNIAALLTRTGHGTRFDALRMQSRGGVTSHFHGFHSTIATPGRLKSFSDRHGNTQKHHWGQVGGRPRLMHVVDSYGRKSHFAYNDSSQNYRMREVTDFWGRKVNFQYDADGRLLAIVGPSITRGANSNSNIFPNGTAYVFQYDVHNPRHERRNDLLKVWFPNQTAPHVGPGRTVDVDAVHAHAKARWHFSYYNDPTDAFNYGKVQQLIESVSGTGAIGSGAQGYVYVNTGLPDNLIDPTDPITSRTIVTDRMGNQKVYDFNINQMVVHKQVFATRAKNSLEAGSWENWTKYNSHNQPLIQVMPEGNSIVNEYEDETNTIRINGMPYAPRIGLLKSTKQLPGNSIGMASRPGSNGQTQLNELYFHEPLFGQTCASIEARGNPISGAGKFFTPQNGGTKPTRKDRSRYATITTFDYQKDSAATVEGDADLCPVSRTVIQIVKVGTLGIPLT